jgi:putative transcriptional regulator
MRKAQFEELLESVREMKAIEKGLKKPSRTFEFPPPNAGQIRRKFQLTQSDFARLIGISVSTLRNWEQGLRVPEGPAQVLLRVVEAHPEAVFEVCAPPKMRTARPGRQNP